MTKSYQFTKALRPFSFVVALIACMTGISYASEQPSFSGLAALLVMMGGLLLQAGVNLINDYADLSMPNAQQPLSAAQQQAIKRNFRYGLGCFAVAGLIAAKLISDSGAALFWLSLVGLIGALGYTLGPINYKQRGLGVPLVFWLMGVLMVGGSGYASSGTLDGLLIWLSLPISLLVALLLLSNELRDCEQDRDNGIQTAVVRIGYQKGAELYRLCIVVLLHLSLINLLISPWFILPLAVLLLAHRPLQLLHQPPQDRTAITPLTGRLLMAYGLVFNLAILLS